MRFFTFIFSFALPSWLFALDDVEHDPSVPVTRQQFTDMNHGVAPSGSWDAGDKVELNAHRGEINRNGVTTSNGIYTIEGLHYRNGSIMINGQYVAGSNMGYIRLYESGPDPEPEPEPEPFNPWGEDFATQQSKTMYGIAVCDDPFGGKMYVVYSVSATLFYSFNLQSYPDVHTTRIRANPPMVQSVIYPAGKIYNEAGSWFEVIDQQLFYNPGGLDTYEARSKTNSITVNAGYRFTVRRSWLPTQSDITITAPISFTWSVPSFG